MDVRMEPGIAAQLWQHRFRGALVATIHRAGSEGSPEVDVAVALGRFHAATGVPLETLEHVVRSLHVDGLLVRENGRVKLGPDFAAFMKKWVEKRAVAVQGEA
jgi:hypothetical protein